MRTTGGRCLLLTVIAAGLVLRGPELPPAQSACCYFSATNTDILQPAQKVFITWDPHEQVESFTVQPKFEGNAKDFGMVIPTPSKPKLDEMPRDFFKELAVFTILKKREHPQSKLLPQPPRGAVANFKGRSGSGGGLDKRSSSSVKVLETGIVGSLDYKIIAADRADDLYTWLKANKYHYAGDEATLDFYVQKKWLFTVMKIDTMQMKRNANGSFAGEVTPTRFVFASEKLIYPLKITQLSVKDTTEALFYVQAPYKVDLPGDLTYQFQWVPMLQNARGWYNKGTFGNNDLPGKADDWLKAIESQKLEELLQRGQQLEFQFTNGQRPRPNRDGRLATTFEWGKRLTAADVNLLRGQAAFGEKLPDPDEGFSAVDLKDAQKANAVFKVIRERLEKYRKERPAGYLVREAPAEDVKQLKLLLGHLKPGQFVTKIRKTFIKEEMNDDLLILPAKLGAAEDKSEYEEILPTSPP